MAISPNDMDVHGAKRYAAPWLFGITNLPYGVSGAYAFVAVPFLLRKAGVPLETIAMLGSLALLPYAYQLLWAPIVDLRIRRRSWLVLCTILGALCLAASTLLKLPNQLTAFEVLLVLGQALVGLVSSCNGALISTTVAPLHRGAAAGWVTAGEMIASVLGGGVVLTLANTISCQAAAVGLILMTILPSLVALCIPEPPPLREPLLKHFSSMRQEVWQVVRSRNGWTGLLLCATPVGTVALTNLFSALGNDYGIPNRTVELVHGYAGGFITAFGALAAGYILDRTSKRKLYLASSLLTAACCTAMALAPLNMISYLAGSLIYLLICGIAWASFQAVVFEIVGGAKNTASTLYSVFPAVGNGAIAYTLFLDGKGYQCWGTRGLFWTDAALNICGFLFLVILLRMVSRLKPPLLANTDNSNHDVDTPIPTAFTK